MYKKCFTPISELKLINLKTHRAQLVSLVDVIAMETCEVENGSPKTPGTFKEIISTLPTENGWNVFQHLCFYQGFWCFPLHLEGGMFAQHHFKAQPTDVLLCSAPKTGTTWLKALSVAIVTRNCVDESNSPLLNKVPHDCIMFLEKDFIENPTQTDQGRLPLVATHLPYTALPKSVLDAGCKLVYICRDPKDAFVSLWHFAKGIKVNNNPNLPIDVAFQLYCKGRSNFGPYWDHVLGYWKASQENPEKVLFMRYEDLLRDTIPQVKKLAEFLGQPFSSKEEKYGAVEKIIRLCSLENLSNLEVNKTGKYGNADIGINNNVYFRKGKIGDWKNYLTPEMGEQLDNVMEERLSGSGFTFLEPN
ncbi:flavonol sulfotransferase-like [Durio zibethinus]|uniref:Sulfotransferase n=1 Tax=Durio zibethinus TaxID=66656 RepID=A0A6P6AMD9_DURZI|nr:flavonol sulfotransferase-like [Durio zibethinus]